MAEKTISHNYPKILNLGMHDAMINGDIVHDIQSRVVFVTSSDELANFTTVEPVGTIAIQYGLANMWQLKPDRTWESV